MNKFINIFDECTNDFICTISVDGSMTDSEIKESIKVVKEEKPFDWTVSDIIEAIGAEIETDTFWI